MSQYMLTGWLVAALLALVCLLGVTAYAEVKQDLPRTACLHGSTDIRKPAATCAACAAMSCEGMTPRA